ncbi:MAG: glycosyltransferase [Burkholderiales bacterium]|nr:glycosyltransferase [Burkholderiales bacterium]
MWGTSWRQRLRLLPLYVAAWLGERLPAAPRTRPPAAWPEGVTVVIPERDAPAMLSQALASVLDALERIAEPWQVIVAANGAPRSTYTEVAARFPAVEWVHSDAPLGFAGAVERGLVRARHGGVYLLNNDMTVEPGALAALLPWRGERVFAIGSQILQQAADGRREETGFTDWYANREGIHLYHAPVPAADEAVPHLAASGGASLFRTAQLREYLADSRAYDPFYWEDVEWSVRAWRDGCDVLFCPGSRVHHRHRATTARFYDKEALARIVERNRLLFDLRHRASGRDARWLLARVCALPYASQRELAHLRRARGVLGLRRARGGQPSPAPTLPGTLPSSYSYRLRAAQAPRRRVLFVTPFAVFPPRHGGARRVAEWVRGQKDAFAVALVTDEASLYDARSFTDFDGLAAVGIVQRDDAGKPSARDLAARIALHCHDALREAVAGALRELRPDVVVIEHAELAPLVRLRAPGARWILDLHDAYGPGDFANMEDARRFAAELSAYDALTVCSEEDAALVRHPRVVCLPNGAQVRGIDYRPSAGHGIVFVGPFRYEQNRLGIERFLREAWPAVRAAVSDATLTILGGDEALAAVANAPLLARDGVRVLGHRDDVARIVADHALAINPLTGIRGSAIKLVETLAQGRVCVTTAEGARGFRSAPGVLTTAGVARMAEPIVALLRDEPERHRLEAPVMEALDAYGWHHSVARQRELFAELT